MSRVPASVKRIYTPLEEAIQELQRRRSDSRVMNMMDEFFRTTGLPFGPNEPILFFCRDIITPNHEFEQLQSLATDLPIALFEYDAKFVARNNDSYHLCRLRFDSTGYHGSECLRIIDFNHNEGVLFSQIRTLNNIPLRVFHHNLLDFEFPTMSESIRDFTTWFAFTRSVTPNYYVHFLALFVCYGIMLENYVVEQQEEAHFFSKRVLPSFKACEEQFGLVPLIAPLLPLKNESDNHWQSYKHTLKEVVMKQGYVF